MAIASRIDLVDILQQIPILQPGQIEEVKKLQPPGEDNAQALAQELVRRGWITLYQARRLVNGRAAELVLGPYVIIDQLGSGGVGQVFMAWHQQMQRVVAIKVLRPDAAKDREVVDRFYREMEVASHVSHPHIVGAYEAGPIGKLLVLALEYLEGTTLEQLVKDTGPQPLARACEFIRQAALGLQYAHEMGLIHRDIKPANLLLTRGTAGGAEMVKILDLGLARLQQMSGSATADLTVAGDRSVMQGTPDYMAPEQALDFHTADIRADIYSLGCTFYFLLAGQPPFSGKTLAEKLMKHQNAEPPLAGVQPPLPAAVAAVLRKMLAKGAAQRYQTPAEVERALKPFCPASATALKTGGSTATIDLSRIPEGPEIRSRTALLAASVFPKRRRWLVLGGVVALVGVTLVGLLIAGVARSPAPAPPPVPTEAAAATKPKPREAARSIGAYAERFQGPSPAPGWQYLWNAKGPIGNPAHYVPMLWDGGGDYNADGKRPLPRPDPAGYVRLARDNGHPGRGAENTPSKFDYCAIAAYTIQPADGPGYYRLTRAALSRGNGLDLMVFLNGRSSLVHSRVPKGLTAPVAFDTNIGLLQPGDTIYVAVGADGRDDSDTFMGFDFTVFRDSGPALPVGQKTVLVQDGFEKPLLTWHQRGKAQFSTVAEQPHGGNQAFQIVVPAGEALTYQQINRVVEENPQPGDTYHLTAWVRTQNVASGPGAYGYIEFVGDKDSRLGLQHTKVHIKNGAKGWEQLSAQAVAPAGTRRVRMGLTLHSEGTAWFDDVEVTRETGTRP